MHLNIFIFSVIIIAGTQIFVEIVLEEAWKLGYATLGEHIFLKYDLDPLTVHDDISFISNTTKELEKYDMLLIIKPTYHSDHHIEELKRKIHHMFHQRFTPADDYTQVT